VSVFTLQANMTRGELTPYVHARGDTDHYQAGLALARNMVVLRYGGLTRCPGTTFDGLTKNANKTSRFIPFEFNRTQVFAIEAGDTYFRFWTPAGRIESPPGTPVEITSPYLEADLKYMQVRQSADRLYITCRGYQPRTLTRTSDTVWTLALYVPQDGPYLDVNVTATVLTPAATGNPVPIMTSNAAPSGTASDSAGSANAYIVFDGKSDSVFAVGATSGWVRYDYAAGAPVVDAYMLRGDINNPENNPSEWTLEGWDGAAWVVIDSRSGQTGWAPGEARYFSFFNLTGYTRHRLFWRALNGGTGLEITQLVLHQLASDQTPFNLTASSTTGINGGAGFAATDVGRAIRILGGDGLWRWANIVARTSSTVVTVQIHGQALPSTTRVINWALGAWSASSGWPSAIAIYEDRLTFARTDTDPLGVWMSVSAAYDNFRKSTPGVDDDGIAVRLTGGKLNDISWLSEGKDILGGTAGSLRAIGRNNPNTALSPSNVRQRSETLTPSSRAEPVDIENVILFLDFYEQRLYEAAWTYEIDGYLAREVSTLNEHLFAAGVEKIVYLSHPHRLIIGLRYDGLLIAFAYDRDQKVTGATLIDIGGVVEDVTQLSGETGTDLWLTVKRTLNGSEKRTVERLAEFWRSEFTVQDMPIYFACARTYDGAATNTVTGITHMLNESVGIWGDGKDLGDATVSAGGVLTLPGGTTAEQIVFGKRMPWKIQTLRLTQIGNRDGSGLGRKTNILTGYVDLYESAGISARAVDLTDADADLLGFDDEAEQDPDDPVTLRTGMFTMKVDDSWKNNGAFVMQGDRAYPVTIRAIQLEVDGEP